MMVLQMMVPPRVTLRTNYSLRLFCVSWLQTGLQDDSAWRAMHSELEANLRQYLASVATFTDVYAKVCPVVKSGLGDGCMISRPCADLLCCCHVSLRLSNLCKNLYGIHSTPPAESSSSRHECCLAWPL